jgi:hypothetical protein
MKDRYRRAMPRTGRRTAIAVAGTAVMAATLLCAAGCGPKPEPIPTPDPASAGRKPYSGPPPTGYGAPVSTSPSPGAPRNR